MSYPWNQYPWAVNGEKLKRAVEQLEKEGKKYTEKDVRALYEKFGGAVKEVEEPKKTRKSKKA